jgi:hypothetical protein
MLIRQSNPPANRKYLLRLRTGAFVHEILTNVREKAEEEPADMAAPWSVLGVPTSPSCQSTDVHQLVSTPAFAASSTVSCNGRRLPFVVEPS